MPAIMQSSYILCVLGISLSCFIRAIITRIFRLTDLYFVLLLLFALLFIFDLFLFCSNFLY